MNILSQIINISAQYFTHYPVLLHLPDLWQIYQLPPLHTPLVLILNGFFTFFTSLLFLCDVLLK